MHTVVLDALHDVHEVILQLGGGQQAKGFNGILPYPVLIIGELL